YARVEVPPSRPLTLFLLVGQHSYSGEGWNFPNVSDFNGDAFAGGLAWRVHDAGIAAFELVGEYGYYRSDACPPTGPTSCTPEVLENTFVDFAPRLVLHSR